MSRIRANAIGPVTGSTLAITGSTLWDPLHPTIDAWGNGTNDDRATLNTLANTTIAATGGTITFRAATYLIASAMTFPQHVTLDFAPGAMLKVASGVVVTLDGPVRAGRHQIFDLQGTGTVVFGSSGSNTVASAEWWGADPDVDSDVFIQQAIVACESASPKVICDLGPGAFGITKPLRIRDNDAVVRGQGVDITTIQPAGSQFEGGPLMIVAPDDWPAFRSLASLVSGEGVAMQLVDDEAQMLALSDLRASRIDGFATFCLEFFFKIDNDATTLEDGGPLIACAGKRTQNETLHTTVRVEMIGSEAAPPGGVLRATLNVGGTEKVLTSGSEVVNHSTTYHCTLDYDGSTVRLFIGEPGTTTTLLDSEAATGTITQSYTEDFLIGTSPERWGTRTRADLGLAPNGAIDSIRISNTSRRTSTYTAPTTKHSSDANTKLLLNFHEVEDGRVGCWHNGSLAWLALYNYGFPNMARGTKIRDLTFGGSGRCIGLWIAATIQHTLERIKLAGGAPWGMVRWRENFVSRMDGLWFTTSADTICQMMNAVNSGVTECHDLTIEGGKYQIADIHGCDLQYDRVFLSPGAETIVGHVISGPGTPTFNNYGVDHETDPDNWEFGLIASALDSATFTACGIGGGSAPAIKIDLVDAFTYVGGSLTNNDPAITHLVEIDRPGASPATFVNTGQVNAPEVPWTDKPEHFVLIRHGQVMRGIYDAGNSGTALTLLSTNGPKQKVTMTGNCTFTVTFDEGSEAELHVLTGAGSFTGTFTSVTWVGGSAPTITATASKLDIFRLWYTNGKRYGEIVGQNLTP